MRDFRDAKAMARTLRAALAAKGLKITIGESLELIAKTFGAAIGIRSPRKSARRRLPRARTPPEPAAAPPAAPRSAHAHAPAGAANPNARPATQPGSYPPPSAAAARTRPPARAALRMRSATDARPQANWPWCPRHRWFGGGRRPSGPLRSLAVRPRPQEHLECARRCINVCISPLRGDDAGRPR